MSEWIDIKDQIPEKGFVWQDDVSGQTGIGCFDDNGRVHLMSSGGHNFWFFKDWSSITRWKPLAPIRKSGDHIKSAEMTNE